MDIGYTDSDSSFSDPSPKVVSPATVLPPAPSSQQAQSSGSLAPELERLREILYGNQARTTERRVTDLESQIETLRRTLTDTLQEKVDTLASSSTAQLSSTRIELTQRLEGQTNEQKAALY